MLHNTGPYGPKETPVNLGAPNIQELANPMNIAQNFNHLVKLSQQAAHSSTKPFNFGNYPCFGDESVSGNSQGSLFPNHSFDVQTGSTSQKLNNYYNSIKHNGTLQESTISNCDDSPKAIDFSSLANNFKKSSEESSTQEPSFTMVEISDLLTNNCSKTTENNSDNSDKCNNKSKNNDSNLFEIWKNFDLKKALQQKRKEKQSLETNADRTTDCESRDSSLDNSNDNVKTESKKQSTYHEDLEEKLNSSEQDESDDESTNASDEDTPKDVDFNGKTNDHKDEDISNDSKPRNLVHFIKQEPIDYETDPVDANIVIKIEPMSSWTDTEHMQAFLKDMNGVSKEDSSLNNDGDCLKGVEEATEIIKNGVKTDITFECPHCCLLFSHPKRFLIHTKWHSFGLTNEKRIEEAKEKMACRKQKKEMQLQIKREAAEAKAKAEQLEKPLQEWFQCKSCDKKFNNKNKLRNHRHKLHPTRERECKICHKVVMGWFGLQTHMAQHSTNGFECDICSKRFKHAHSLAKHRDTHLEKTHACSECPKKFGSPTLLRIHMRSHERAQRGRTFRCSYCAKGFYEAYTLQYHERTHRNERPFKCEICETSYGTNSSLKRHVKVSHSNVAKPFECDTCKRCFVTELIRDRHAAREHGTPGQLKYACTMCTSRYLRLKDLQRHMYRIHPKGKKRRKDSESE